MVVVVLVRGVVSGCNGVAVMVVFLLAAVVGRCSFAVVNGGGGGCSSCGGCCVVHVSGGCSGGRVVVVHISVVVGCGCCVRVSSIGFAVNRCCSFAAVDGGGGCCSCSGVCVVVHVS